MKTYKYTYSLLYKQQGNPDIQFISINTNITFVDDFMLLINQQIKNSNIPANAQLVSINLSGVNE